MLYICIFSNKFDLKQTIRVLHNILILFEFRFSFSSPKIIGKIIFVNARIQVQYVYPATDMMSLFSS